MYYPFKPTAHITQQRIHRNLLRQLSSVPHSFSMHVFIPRISGLPRISVSNYYVTQQAFAKTPRPIHILAHFTLEQGTTAKLARTPESKGREGV